MRLLPITILLLISISGSFAQKMVYPSWEFGIQGGSNFNTASFYPSVNAKYSQGFNGGIMIGYKNMKTVGVITEFNYSQKGWIEKPQDTQIGNYSVKLAYAEFAIMSHVVLGKNNLKGVINAGPFYARHLSTELSSTEEITDSNYSNYFHRGHDINYKNDFGFIAALGFGYQTKVGRIQLQGRIVQSLNRLYFKKPDGYFENSIAQAIQINLGYVFVIDTRPILYKKPPKEDQAGK
jgi:hypothetical protein